MSIILEPSLNIDRVKVTDLQLQELENNNEKKKADVRVMSKCDCYQDVKHHLRDVW